MLGGRKEHGDDVCELLERGVHVPAALEAWATEPAKGKIESPLRLTIFATCDRARLVRRLVDHNDLNN